VFANNGAKLFVIEKCRMNSTSSIMQEDIESLQPKSLKINSMKRN